MKARRILMAFEPLQRKAYCLHNDLFLVVSVVAYLSTEFSAVKKAYEYLWGRKVARLLGNTSKCHCVLVGDDLYARNDWHNTLHILTDAITQDLFNPMTFISSYYPNCQHAGNFVMWQVTWRYPFFIMSREKIRVAMALYIYVERRCPVVRPRHLWWRGSAGSYWRVVLPWRKELFSTLHKYW